ncbi:MAG: DUF4352 domain-containing protein [Candidatus Metalachnospira sp.]|jgi:hypothetical protein
MAFKKCPECNQDVSEQARMCPKCGYSFIDENTISTENSSKKTVKKKHGCLISFVFVIFLCILVNINTPHTNVPTSTGESEEIYYYLGSPFTTEELEITINSIQEVSSIPAANGYMKYTPESGKYGLIEITVKNTSSSLIRFDFTDFQLYDSQNNHYAPSSTLISDLNILWFEDLNPNLETSGYIIYNIPDDLSLSSCTLKYSGSLFDDITSFYLVEQP